MRTLVLDTASKFLYFSFIENGQVVFENFTEGKNDHSDNLLKKIDEALLQLNWKLKDFSKVIVGIGPGSYTGVRLSATVAKVLAWTQNLPLYKTSSLDLLSSGYYEDSGIYAITLRAKKNHVYGKLVQVKGPKVQTIFQDMIYLETDFFEKISNYDYKIVNESNYKINIEKLILEKVEDPHQLLPNYIQKEV